MKNTPENIQAWGKLYKDGIIDGDKVVLTKDFHSYIKGTEGIIRIRWDGILDCPSRASISHRRGDEPIRFTRWRGLTLYTPQAWG